MNTVPWEITCWILLAIIQIDLLSIAVGLSRWRLLIFLQSVTPLLFPVSAAVAVISAMAGWTILAGTAVAQMVWIAIIIVGSLRQQRRSAPNGDTRLRIAHANVLHSNQFAERAVADILATDADIIAFSEITERIHHQAELHPTAEHWPHRIHDLQDGPRGIALWSKRPLATAVVEKMHDCHAIVAEVDGDTRLRVLAVHPMAPVSPQKTRDWGPSLQTIGQALVDSHLPTVAIGDYNAAHWHPPMRRLYRQGIHSAHLRVGRILSTTFPVGRRLRPFVILDHALVTEDVHVHVLTHLKVTGSDHLGIVVDLSLAQNPEEQSAG